MQLSCSYKDICIHGAIRIGRVKLIMTVMK